MSSLPDTFPAFIVHRDDDGRVSRAPQRISAEDLGPGGVTIRVHWSGVNYKDALASTAEGKIARVNPLVPGIDLAGEVIDGGDAFPVGTPVLAHGYDLGVARYGGFSRYARVARGVGRASPERPRHPLGDAYRHCRFHRGPVRGPA